MRPIAPLRIHPLLRMYATSVWPLERTEKRAEDRVSGVNPLIFGTGIAEPHWGYRAEGPCLTFDGTDTTALGTVVVNNSYPIWLAGSFIFDSNLTDNTLVGLGSEGGTAAFTLIGTDFAGGTLWGRFRKTDGGIRADVIGPVAVNGKLYHCSFITRGNTSHTLFVNGAKFTSATDVGAGAFANQIKMSIGVSNRQSIFTAWLTGGVYWAAYGRVDPGDVFLRNLSIDPWKYLYAPRKRIFLSSFTGIQFDAASSSGYKTASASYTWSHTCLGTDRYLTVGISMLSVAGSSVTGITYNSVALTKIGHIASASGAVRSELWGLIAPATGTNTIEVTLSAALDSAGSASSYTGVHQTSPIEGFNTASATNVGAADATIDVTTVADNDWVVDNVATDDTAISVGAGQTQRGNTTGTLGSGAMSTEGPKTPAGSVTMSWTDVAALATWSIGAVALRPVAAANLGRGLFIPPHLTGLGSGGSFFSDRLSG